MKSFRGISLHSNSIFEFMMAGQFYQSHVVVRFCIIHAFVRRMDRTKSNATPNHTISSIGCDLQGVSSIVDLPGSAHDISCQLHNDNGTSVTHTNLHADRGSPLTTPLTTADIRYSFWCVSHLNHSPGNHEK